MQFKEATETVKKRSPHYKIKALLLTNSNIESVENKNDFPVGCCAVTKISIISFLGSIHKSSSQEKSELAFSG